MRSCLAQGSSPPLPPLSQALPTQGHIKRSSQVPSLLWGERGMVRKSQQWPEQALGFLHCPPSPGTKISRKIPEEGPWICSSEILQQVLPTGMAPHLLWFCSPGGPWPSGFSDCPTAQGNMFLLHLVLM